MYRILIVTLLWCCAAHASKSDKFEDPEPIPLNGKYTLDQVQLALENTFALLNWSVIKKDKDPNILTAKKTFGNQINSASINVNYNTDTMGIFYANSENLDYEEKSKKRYISELYINDIEYLREKIIQSLKAGEPGYFDFRYVVNSRSEREIPKEYQSYVRFSHNHEDINASAVIFPTIKHCRKNKGSRYLKLKEEVSLIVDSRKEFIFGVGYEAQCIYLASFRPDAGQEYVLNVRRDNSGQCYLEKNIDPVTGTEIIEYLGTTSMLDPLSKPQAECFNSYKSYNDIHSIDKLL